MSDHIVISGALLLNMISREVIQVDALAIQGFQVSFLHMFRMTISVTVGA